MKTYTKEEWKESLEPSFISNARKQNYFKLDNLFKEVKEDYLRIIQSGFEKIPIEELTSNVDLDEIAHLNLKDLKGEISNLRSILVERTKQLKNQEDFKKVLRRK